MPTAWVTPQQYQHLADISSREGIVPDQELREMYRSALALLALEGRLDGDVNLILAGRLELKLIVGNPPANQ